MTSFHDNTLQSAFVMALGAILIDSVVAEPASAQGITQLLRRLETRIEELEREISDVRRTAIIVQSGTFPMVARNTRGLRDKSACPERETGDADRGTLNGRIEFPQKFSQAPEVVVALREATISPVTRIRLDVTTKDERGFNYKFTTYCKTIIYNAHAVWVAHGRMSP